MKPCGSNWMRIEEAQSKNQCTHPDSASSVDGKWSKHYGNLIHPDRATAPQSSKKALTSVFIMVFTL